MNRYLGIKYAKADIWQDPGLVQTYAANTQALEYGSICVQSGASGDGQSAAMVDAPPMAGSTDCLYLNIWTPTTGGGDKPVMVFIHGGAFVFGSGSDPLYDGENFARRQGVVLVTLNYRLGAFGFLPTSDQPSQGNFGIADQVAALQWVQNNIRSFGGDPANVTIFGESAGAMSVGLHLFSAKPSTSLFKAGIMESNPLGYLYPEGEQQIADVKTDFTKCLNTAMGNDQTPDAPATSGEGDDALIGCGEDTTWPTGTIDAEDVYKAQLLYSGDALLGRINVMGLPEGLPFTPLIDTQYLTQAPQKFSPATASDPAKPFMFGFNADEGVLFSALLADKVEVKGYDTPMSRLAALGYAEYAKGDCPLPGLYPDLSGYYCLISLMFENPQNIDGKDTPDAPEAYAPDNMPDSMEKSPLNKSFTAVANVITDFGFVCENMQAPTSSLSSGTYGAPVWGYVFTQAPVEAPQPPAEACTPSDEHDYYTCHEAELPFVFYNMPDTATTEEMDLAASMNTAWASFAQRPEQAPMSDWADWNTGDPAKIHVLDSATPAWTAPDCGFWAKQTPIDNQ